MCIIARYVWLLIAYFALGLIYIYAVPVYEAPDEDFHFAFADYVAQTGLLPVQDRETGKFNYWKQEGSQPPLYYLLSAQIVRFFNRDDYAQVTQRNPHAVLGQPGTPGNKNVFLHTQIYPPPLHGSALATYAVRLFSLILGGITVFAVYQTAHTLLPDREHIALLAAGLTAFNPQFLFISASVNNDNLVTALNSLIIWQMLVMLRQGFATRRSLILAVLVALATLSKLGGLIMVVIVALAGLYTAYRTRNLRGLIILGSAMLFIWLGLAAWWYVRNLTLYSELFGTQTMLAIIGARSEPLTFSALLAELSSLPISYWGLFGWFSIYTLNAYYIVIIALMIAALIGFFAYLWQNRANRTHGIHLFFLTFTMTLGFIALIFWTLQTEGTQGRLLFPYSAATSTVLALGLVTLFKRRFAFTIVAALEIYAAVVPFITLIPEYAPPATIATLPENAQSTDVSFKAIRLIGYQINDQRYTDSVPVTLYWQAKKPSKKNFSLYLHLIDPTGEVLGKIDTYPGWGKLQTKHWQSDVIYQDGYQIPITESPDGAFPLRLQVGWWDQKKNKPVKSENSSGEPLSAVILPTGAYIHAPDNSGDWQSADGDFGGQIALRGYQWQDGTLSLLWEALADLNQDYTVVVMAFADEYQRSSEIIAQGDAAPTLPTHYWRKGEQFTSLHTLNFTQGWVYIGWYRPEDFVRLETGTPDQLLLLFNEE